jgi:subtilisin family serine protease
VTDPPDVFAEVFSLLTPERVLLDPRATGEGVDVCVVDSGVERAVLEAKFARDGKELHPIKGGVFAAERAEPLPYDGRQSSPHGTTVADIVLTVAPRVRLWSADVFGPGGTCEVDVLVRAIHWAAEVWRCKVINLSLGVTEQRLQPPLRRVQLQRAIEECYHNDVLVIAAAHNEHPLTRSYPAAFAPPLLSVDKRLYADPLEFDYGPLGRVEFSARGKGYLGPFAAEPATSWAAPHLAGIAARVLSLRPGLKPFEMKTILYWLARSRRRPAE